MNIVTEYPPTSQNNIEAILRDFDAVFDPCLSKRVKIEDYANKLAKNAIWFYVYDQERITAHCAVYMNQPDNAFISSIAVKKEMQGRGIGDCLWECVEKEAKQRGIYRIRLSVMKTNLSGILFYTKHDCSILEDSGEWLMMEKFLESHYVACGD